MNTEKFTDISKSQIYGNDDSPQMLNKNHKINDTNKNRSNTVEQKEDNNDTIESIQNPPKIDFSKMNTMKYDEPSPIVSVNQKVNVCIFFFFFVTLFRFQSRYNAKKRTKKIPCAFTVLWSLCVFLGPKKGIKSKKHTKTNKKHPTCCVFCRLYGNVQYANMKMMNRVGFVLNVVHLMP